MYFYSINYSLPLLGVYVEITQKSSILNNGYYREGVETSCVLEVFIKSFVSC